MDPHLISFAGIFSWFALFGCPFPWTLILSHPFPTKFFVRWRHMLILCTLSIGRSFCVPRLSEFLVVFPRFSRPPVTFFFLEGTVSCASVVRPNYLQSCLSHVASVSQRGTSFSPPLQQPCPLFSTGFFPFPYSSFFAPTLLIINPFP